MVLLPGKFLDGLVALLHDCRQTKSLPQAKRIHAYLCHHKLEDHRVLGNYLVPALVECGCLPDAVHVFRRLTSRNEHCWSSLISGFAQSGDLHLAFHLCHRMQQEHVQPNSYTFVSLLKGCSALVNIETGHAVHADVVKKGLEGDPFIGNTLVDMYSNCGCLPDAQCIFRSLQVRDGVSWNAMIAGYADHELGEEALDCFEQMRSDGVPPADVTYTSMLKACSSLKALERGHKLYSDITKQGFENDLFIGSAIVDLYAKCGSLAEAQDVLLKLPVRDVVLWTAIIAGYTEHGFGEEALNCFEKMQLENVHPVAVTFTCSLKACGSIGALETGREIHAETTKRGLERGLPVANTLIDMYGKCGSLMEAHDVFRKLPSKSIVSWTAMINGYGENHSSGMAIQCFENMKEQGVKPNDVTFLCLLAACSQASLVLKGQEYFNMMIKEHKIEPTLDHYACLVDILARSGHVYEAEKFAKVMQCLPTKEVLRALLTACKIHGELEVGLRCFQQLVFTNEEDVAVYMLMADMYASERRWSEAIKMEEMRKSARAKKVLASASTEVNKVLQEFVIGNGLSKDTAAMLEALNLHMKSEGYVPSLDLIVSHM